MSHLGRLASQLRWFRGASCSLVLLILIATIFLETYILDMFRGFSDARVRSNSGAASLVVQMNRLGGTLILMYLLLLKFTLCWNRFSGVPVCSLLRS